jgi:hypothetical protein
VLSSPDPARALLSSGRAGLPHGGAYHQVHLRLDRPGLEGELRAACQVAFPSLGLRGSESRVTEVL